MVLEKRNDFLDLVNMFITDDNEKEKLLNAYNKINGVTNYLCEKGNLTHDEIGILSENFTEKYVEEHPELEQEFENDFIGTICKIYQMFVESKGYTENYIEELKVLMNFLLKINEKDI